MNWKKLIKALLYPRMGIMLLLIPISACALIYAFSYLQSNDPVCIAVYTLSAYALAVWCLRIPRCIRLLRRFKHNNKYAALWLKNTRLRVNITLSATFIWNSAYALLQFGLGLYHRSLWFFSLFGYYFLLAFMRLMLVRYSARHEPGEIMRMELGRYRICGWVFLLMNLALSSMIFFMIYGSAAPQHGVIVTIAMAAYTFTSLTMSIINVVKYRKYNSPVYSASKAISLAAACVSLLTLERTMLGTFSGEKMAPDIQRLFLLLSGLAISVFIVAMAIYMIIKASRSIKELEAENEPNEQ